MTFTDYDSRISISTKQILTFISMLAQKINKHQLRCIITLLQIKYNYTNKTKI